MQDPELWKRISECHPDDVEADFPFSRRLARDNGWTHDYALSVITEYQRFAYLCRMKSGMVTPSDEVDQAWHLHLTYTRHYWGVFKDALGGALHHMPTKGGAGQATLFREAYQKTLDLYETEFSTRPPEDIWPSPDVRFGKAPHFQRINTRDVWVVPKPAWPNMIGESISAIGRLPRWAKASILTLPTLALGTGLAFAHGTAQGANFFERLRNMIWHWATQHTVEVIVACFLLGVLLLAVFNFVTGNPTQRGRRSRGDSGCSGGVGGHDSSGDSGGGSGCSGCGGGGD
ncbi:hypothetical protein ABVF61_12545 [Roseibium sp. HPY-6]|uniref:glycine-rich domain-containing protein n=1 Tax=Roseibium sp. HPY-6 TaxID=3229852 RepID=UPI00338F3734